MVSFIDHRTPLSQKSDPGSRSHCRRCYLPVRWCVCFDLPKAESTLAVDVLMHHRELARPSSTGHLIERAVSQARCHLWRSERGLNAGEVNPDGRELWVLHPAGRPMPESADPQRLRIVLLDGSWNEAGKLARATVGWGRRVSLPMEGESRFWLRSQQEGGRYSTVESLLFLYRAFGLESAWKALNLAFELHVYAGLRSRGRKELACAFLEGSVLRGESLDVLEKLESRRGAEAGPVPSTSAVPGSQR